MTAKIMDYERTYSLADIARKIERPRTTLKDWTEVFIEFLPTVGSGRTMRYKENAIEIFALIAKMKDTNLPNEHIRNHLRGIVREITIVPEDDSEEKPFLINIVEKYETLTEEVQELRIAILNLTQRIETVIHNEVKTEIATASEQIYTKLNNVNEQLQNQSEKMKQHQEQLTTITSTLSRVETYRKKTIWSKIFGR